jgi:hypothetical protein
LIAALTVISGILVELSGRLILVGSESSVDRVAEATTSEETEKLKAPAVGVTSGVEMTEYRSDAVRLSGLSWISKLLVVGISWSVVIVGTRAVLRSLVMPSAIAVDGTTSGSEERVMLADVDIPVDGASIASVPTDVKILEIPVLESTSRVGKVGTMSGTVRVAESSV